MSVVANPQDLKLYVDDAVVTVFENMLGMMIDPSRYLANLTVGEPQVIGMVSITGATQGVVCLRVSQLFSNLATSVMLDMDEELISEPDVNDVVGELTNMIAGKVKAALSTGREVCGLSLPTIARGRKIDLESVSGVKRHSFAFSHETGAVVLEIYSLNKPEKKYE